MAAVRQLRLGDAGGSPRQAFGVSAEIPEPVHGLLCDAIGPPVEIHRGSIPAYVPLANGQVPQLPVGGGPIELHGSARRRWDGCDCHFRSGRHRLLQNHPGGRVVGDAVVPRQRLQLLDGLLVDGNQGITDRNRPAPDRDLYRLGGPFPGGRGTPCLPWRRRMDAPADRPVFRP